MLLDLLTLSCYSEKVMYSVFQKRQLRSLVLDILLFGKKGDVNLKILL